MGVLSDSLGHEICNVSSMEAVETRNSELSLGAKTSSAVNCRQMSPL